MVVSQVAVALITRVNLLGCLHSSFTEYFLTMIFNISSFSNAPNFTILRVGTFTIREVFLRLFNWLWWLIKKLFSNAYSNENGRNSVGDKEDNLKC